MASELCSVCSGKVAVVGNGPITDEDREKINSDGRYDCVVRFNDMKNRQDGEKTTIHASRYAQSHFPGVTLIDDDSGVHLWPIAVNEGIAKDNKELAGRANVLSTLLVHEPSAGSHNNKLPGDTMLFGDCTKCTTDFNCVHDAQKNGPSSGAAVLDKLSSTSCVDSIDVFGMNWNGGSHHVDFAQPEIVPSCCTKCTINDAATKYYDGRAAHVRTIDWARHRLNHASALIREMM